MGEVLKVELEIPGDALWCADMLMRSMFSCAWSACGGWLYRHV
jgi:hypothetical protein